MALTLQFLLTQSPDWFGAKLFVVNGKSVIALYISPEIPQMLLFSSLAIYSTLA